MSIVVVVGSVLPSIVVVANRGVVDVDDVDNDDDVCSLFRRLLLLMLLLLLMFKCNADEVVEDVRIDDDVGNACQAKSHTK